MLTSLVVDNWYVGIPLVMALMLLDALLTQLGHKSYLRHGKQHSELEHHELNPYWQKDVEEKGCVFSLRYVRALGIRCAILGLSYAFLPRIVTEALVGFECGRFVPIVLTHVGILLYYPALSRTPGAVEGKIAYSYRFMLVSNAINKLTTGLLLSALLLFTELSVFTVAFAIAQFFGVLESLSWARRARTENESGEKDRRRINVYFALRLVMALSLAAILIFYAFDPLSGGRYRRDFQNANDAYDNGDYETAAEIFEELLRRNPDDLDAHFNLGLCYYQAGRFGMARGVFERYAEKYGTQGRQEEARMMLDWCKRDSRPEEE